MKTTPFQYFSSRPVLTGAVMFSVLMFLTQFIAYERYSLLRENEEQELINEANSTQDRLQNAISYSRSTAQTLGFIVEHYGVPDNFDSVGNALLQSNKFIDAVQLVQGGLITHVVPLAGNETVIGYNILKDSARNSGALHAIATKKFFWAGPFDLKQGGVGIVGRQPLYKANKFWGFSAVLIKLPTFLKIVGIDSTTNNGFSYQLSNINTDRNFLPEQHLSATAQTVSVKVPDVEWKLVVGKKSNASIFFAFTFSLLGLILSITGGLFAWFMARQPQQLNKLVEEKTVALMASENNLLNTLERVSDAFVAIDTNFCYTYMNKKAGEIFHRHPQTIVGKNMWEEFPDWVNKPFYKVFVEAMKNQQYVLLEEYYPKQSLWFESRIYPSSNGLSVFIQDITERKKAEQEILREKNLSDSIINSLPGAFYLYDKTGKFIRWNKNFETVSGYSAEEVSQMHPLDFFDGQEKVKVLEKVEEVFSKGMSEVEAEFVAKTKQKTPYYFNGNLATFDGKDYLIGMGIDITDRKKAEEEIVLEKNLSDSIVNSLPGVFYLADITGKMLRWNKNFETVSGYTAAEISNMRVRDFVALDEQKNLLMKKEMAIQQGISDVEANFLTKQKQTLPFHFTSVFSKYKDQPCLLGVGIDITERKKAEWAVIESEEKYRSLIQSSPDIIMRLDLEEKVQFINYTGGGFTPEQIIGSSAYNFVMPEFHTLVRETHKRAVESQQPQSYETSALGLDGIKRWFYTSVGPIILNGKVTGITLITRDITQRVEVEKALKASEEKYRYLFDNNPALIMIWDLETLKILEVNEKVNELYGYTKEEFLNMTVLDYRPVEDHSKIKNFAADMLASNDPIYRATWKHLKKNGDVMYMEISSHRINYKNRKAILSLGADVTEKILIAEQLNKSYEDIRQLNNYLQTIREEERTAISRELHDELGQQLTALKMDISWIGKKTNPADVLLKEKIAESSALVDETVKTIRRINTDLRPGILDDLGLFSALDWQAKEFTKRTGIACNMHLCDNEPVLDKNITINIFRIFQETLTNITRHANATEVTASLEIKNQALLMTITDNGIGFNADEVKQKKSFGLLGVKERAVAMNAGIEIVSQKGNGTTIKLTLPIIS